VRIEALQPLEGGITRIREKGGANPRWLYDCLNGYVDMDGAVQSRPGTTDEIQLPAGTKGLAAVNNGLVVFSHQAVATGNPLVTCEALPHPEGIATEIRWIHFAEPFLGNDERSFLYVVVEYANGDVYHFWLRLAQDWKASTTYTLGAMVQPTTPNGYLYRAHRLNPAGIKWAANVKRTVGDKVEPTKFSGYEHTVIETIGDNPRSGPTEPDWAEADGGITIEDTGAGTVPPPETGTTTPPTTDPGAGGGGDRYGVGGDGSGELSSF
jgi:hypothetical protein